MFAKFLSLLRFVVITTSEIDFPLPNVPSLLFYDALLLVASTLELFDFWDIELALNFWTALEVASS